MLFQLAMKQVWRERNNAQFRILALALWLAVFAVTVLGCLTQTFRASIGEQAANLLGADMVMESPSALAPEYQNVAENQKLSANLSIEFLSMMIAEDKLQLASITAIQPHFPLRGELEVETNNGVIRQGPPPKGQVWVEETLALRLNRHLNDEVDIGSAHFRISGIIRQRPVALSESSVLAPVAYVNAEDLPAMNVLQPGSRASYRLLLAADKEALKAYRQHFEKADSDLRWITPEEGRSSLSRTMTYVQRYLSVILLIQVLLAGIAIALCAHQYSMRQQKMVALWRSFGASGKTIVRLQVLSLLLLAMFVLATAIIFGYLVTSLSLHYGKQLGLPPMTVGWQGIGLGALTGMIMLWGFALPPILQLKRISPVQILQRDKTYSPSISVFSYITAFVSLAGLFILFIDEREMAFRISSQILGMCIIAFACSYILWHGFIPFSRSKKPAWRFGLSYLMRHKWQGVTQWLVFSMVMMLLLLVQIIQRDLISMWQAQLPVSTPNYFLLNIQPEQIKPMTQWFQKQGINDVQFYPIVRARMSHVNGVAIESLNQQHKNEQQGLQRPINLTWMQHLPKDNKWVAGDVWENIPSGQPLISVEKSFAERQHLKLGDTIGFQMADERVTGKIVQLRTVEWETFKPNFFVIFPPLVIERFPHSYITSIYLSNDQKLLLNELIKEFVEISIIDIDAILKQMQEMMAKVSIGLNSLLALVFVLGILIMYASLLSSLKERLQESALLQILGANKIFILKVLTIEFSLLGIISGCLAGLMALIAAHDLATRFFGLSYGFEFKWVLIGIIMSTIIILACGLFGARRVFQVSPLWLLRRS